MKQPKNVALTNRNIMQVHVAGLLPIIQKAPMTPSQRWYTVYTIQEPYTCKLPSPGQ